MAAIPAITPLPTPTDGRRARGEDTRRAILEQAAQLASHEGLDGLTIGGLASELGMSKSGLFAHFGSKEELQLAVIDSARDTFVEEVVDPVRDLEPGVRRLRALMESWMSYMERDVFSGGCFFMAATAEFDSRPGPVRDRLREVMVEWLGGIREEIEEARRRRELPRRTDAERLAFELDSIGLGANWTFQLFRSHDAFRLARLSFAERLGNNGE